MLRDGLFTHHGPTFAFYRLSAHGHSQTGLIAEVAIEDYRHGRIRRHEHTQPDAERRLASSLDTLRADLNPVGLTYRSLPTLNLLAGKLTAGAPALELTTADGVEHTVWTVDPYHTNALREILTAVDRLYITDGHHRLAAAARHAARCRTDNPAHTGDEPYNFVLAVLFPHDQMRVLGYHRCVARPGGTATQTILDDIARQRGVRGVTRALAEDARHPTPRCCLAFVDGAWYRIHLDPGGGRAGGDGGVGSPDATVLQEHVLAPVFGITSPGADPRLDYVPGTVDCSDPAAIEQRCGLRDEIAFVLHPPHVDEVLATADAGLVLPPKSTWFTPKAHAGAFLRFSGNGGAAT